MKNNPQESELFIDIVMEQFLKQQIFPEIKTVEAETTYQLLGAPKVYIYSDNFTLTKIQIYLMINYPENWDYLMDFLVVRPREDFLNSQVNINPNSLVFLTYPENVKEGLRKINFAKNYSIIAHDLCCQVTSIFSG